MARYVARRILGSLIVLWAVATLVFFIIQLAPGDPALLYLGYDASPEDVARLRQSLGLDQPLPVQYWAYISNLVRGDLGTSIFTRRPVAQTLLDRAPTTLELAFFTILFSSTCAVLLGMTAAAHRDSARDGLIRVGTVVGISIPNFWLGLMLILIFGLAIPGILPPGGWVPFTQDPLANVQRLVLPVIVLSTSNLALVSRTLRVSMLDTLSRDYVMFARAMGLAEGRVLRAVALPNAIIPTATVIGIALGHMIGGSVVVETVFTIPGIGQLLVDSFQKRDYPVAVGTTIFATSAFVVLTLVVDLLYAVFNPRIRDLYVQRMEPAHA